MNVGSFLAWAERQMEGDYELIDGKVYRMASERNWHAVYKSNIFTALDKACRRSEIDLFAFCDGPGIEIGSQTVRVPDAIVNEGRVKRGSLVVDRPVIVVEVVSEDSERRDHGSKFVEYFGLATVRHYLLVLHDKRRVIWHRRTSPNALVETSIIAQGSMTLGPYDLTIAFQDIFDDSAFE